ncbi:MAG: MFS transporter, partial [Planctomycetia bacterium]|nr:MFS transporter [Planctomycetia bacterium]
RYNLLSFLCAATVIAYLQRSALGVPSKQIESDLGITSQHLGLVWLAWYAGYAVGQIPSGWVADRLGSKHALIIFAVVWSVLTALTGTATGFTGLWVLWGTMGLAQAGIFVCATKAIGATFPRTEQAFASGALACCMAGGAALSQYLTGQLLDPHSWFGPLSWQAILVVYAVPGLLWAVGFTLIVPRPEKPQPQPETESDWTPVPPAPAEPLAPVRWSRLFTDWQMILLCSQQFMRAAAFALFFTWFPRYLQEAFGVSKAESGQLAAWPLIVGMFGGLLGGTISDWLLRQTGSVRLSRQGLAIVGTTLCTLVAMAAYRAESAQAVVILVSIAGFCGYLSGVSAYATAISMGGKRVAPVFATMNMSGNIGAGVFPFVVGQVVGATGNWNVTLLLFAGLFAGSAICWALLNPKGTLFEEPS